MVLTAPMGVFTLVKVEPEALTRLSRSINPTIVAPRYIVSDPMGYVIAEADGKEQILYADCDLKKVKRMQDRWGFISARRPEEYRPICEL